MSLKGKIVCLFSTMCGELESYEIVRIPQTSQEVSLQKSSAKAEPLETSVAGWFTKAMQKNGYPLNAKGASMTSYSGLGMKENSHDRQANCALQEALRQYTDALSAVHVNFGVKLNAYKRKLINDGALTQMFVHTSKIAMMDMGTGGRTGCISVLYATKWLRLNIITRKARMLLITHPSNIEKIKRLSMVDDSLQSEMHLFSKGYKLIECPFMPAMRPSGTYSINGRGRYEKDKIRIKHRFIEYGQKTSTTWFTLGSSRRSRR